MIIPPRNYFPLRRRPAFTLVEMLVSMAVLILLMTIILSVTSALSKSWRNTAGNASSFQDARTAFETLTQTLSQATLETYWDYVDASGNPRTVSAANNSISSASAFTPAGYARSSELHFLAGQDTESVGSTTLVPGATGNNTQGNAIFFQAPLGRSTAAAYQPLDSSLNALGFFVQYANDAGDWPSFVQANMSQSQGGANYYRFRLMEWVQQTQNVQIYASTSQSGTSGQTQYNTSWISSYLPAVGQSPTAGQDAPRVLAEDVPLLVILPQLTPQDETALNGSAPPYPGTLLCPNYQYDSRTWCSGYSGNISGSVGSYTLQSLMRNQLPPLVEVVMVAISDRDMIRLQQQNSNQTAIPVALQVQSGAFQSSASLDSDLQAYESQLISNHVNFKTFRTTVQLRAAKWSMPNY